MTETSPSSFSIPSKPTYTCIRCAERKVKCDRQRPCSACVKHNVQCFFKPSQPPRPRQKRVQGQILSERLKRYESLLRAQGIDPDKLPDVPSSERASAAAPSESQAERLSVDSASSRFVAKPQVQSNQGGFPLVDNRLWSRVVEECHESEATWENSSVDTTDPDSGDDDFGYVLKLHSKSSSRPSHPQPEQIRHLWEIFVENVDPLTKAVHVPSLRPAIEKALGNLEAVPRNFESLMFAIYSTAVMSLDNSRCLQIFGTPRKTMLSRYISATSLALSRANLMGTTSLVVLQALVLHLISVRDVHEPRSVWSLTGVAVRIAQSIGLERDGEVLGLPQFETEIRRRIWWLLKTHDFRTAELCGLDKARDIVTGAQSPQGPSNINDDQLFPGQTSMNVESHNLTDAVFVSLKYELANLAADQIAKYRQQENVSSQSDLNLSRSNGSKIDNVDTIFEDFLETRFVRYCDPSQPLHLLTMLVARISINVIRFSTHHPRRWSNLEKTPLSERQLVWDLGIKILEQYNMVQSNPMLKGFAWNARYYQQWHALIHTLDTLRSNPLTKHADKAWQLIGNLYEITPDLISDTKKPIHVAMGNLSLKAYHDRQVALQNGNMPVVSPPDFILKLRQQREAAIAKRQARNGESSQAQDQPAIIISSQQKDAGLAKAINCSESAHSTINTTSQASKSGVIWNNPQEDVFWFTNGFETGQAGNTVDLFDMNMDLGQEFAMQDALIPQISWEQWDVWLAESNIIHPPSAGMNITSAP